MMDDEQYRRAISLTAIIILVLFLTYFLLWDDQMSVPEPKYFALQEQLRRLTACTTNLYVPSADLINLLDYINELEEAQYAAWEYRMGEDL
jgi:hypothetical protein